jgi:hypothetical protein
MNEILAPNPRNALSDQPPAVREEMSRQLGQLMKGRPVGRPGLSLHQLIGHKEHAPAGDRALASIPVPVLDRSFESVLTSVLTGIIGQLIGAAGQRGAENGNPAVARSLLDPGFIQLLTGIFNQLTGARSAPSAPAAGTSRDLMKLGQIYTIANGAFEDFPTWSFWGETHVRMDNTGTIPTTVLVNDARYFLNPGEGTTMSGKWAAFPIRITNASEDKSAMVTVRVW